MAFLTIHIHPYPKKPRHFSPPALKLLKCFSRCAPSTFTLTVNFKNKLRVNNFRISLQRCFGSFLACYNRPSTCPHALWLMDIMSSASRTCLKGEEKTLKTIDSKLQINKHPLWWLNEKFSRTSNGRLRHVWYEKRKVINHCLKWQFETTQKIKKLLKCNWVSFEIWFPAEVNSNKTTQHKQLQDPVMKLSPCELT